MVYEVPVTRARAEFADLLNRVVYGGERVVLTRHGKPIAALVSAADLDRLEDADQERSAPVIRLSSDPPGRLAPTDPPAHRRLDIAAEYRPPGRDNRPGGRG